MMNYWPEPPEKIYDTLAWCGIVAGIILLALPWLITEVAR